MNCPFCRSPMAPGRLEIHAGFWPRVAFLARFASVFAREHIWFTVDGDTEKQLIVRNPNGITVRPEADGAGPKAYLCPACRALLVRGSRAVTPATDKIKRSDDRECFAPADT